MRIKIFLSLIFTFFKTTLFSQDFITYNDTLNHFSVGIPSGWIIGTKFKDDPTALNVRLKNINEGGIIPSYTVNLIKHKNTNLKKFYDNYCRPIDSQAEDNVLVEEGDHFANGITYKWILTKKKTIEIRSLAYYCYKDGFVYQISFTTDLPNYLKYEQTFKKVIETFKL